MAKLPDEIITTVFTLQRQLYVTLRRIYESQPIASRDSLEIVARSINEAQAVSAATLASVQEIKRNWNLP